MFPQPLIHCENLRKTYTLGKTIVKALDCVSLSINDGEFVAIIGSSGSGKSTLMNLLGGLDNPTDGHVTINGERLDNLKHKQLAQFRNKTIGFVFQQFQLLPKKSALTNVLLPFQYADKPPKDRKAVAAEHLKTVGLGDRLRHKPTELSGGQQQRVAIARALVNSPKILLADEPTGALDSKTSLEIMELLKKLNEDGITIIVITHEENVARYAQRTIELVDGQIKTDSRAQEAEL